MVMRNQWVLHDGPKLCPFEVGLNLSIPVSFVLHKVWLGKQTLNSLMEQGSRQVRDRVDLHLYIVPASFAVRGEHRAKVDFLILSGSGEVLDTVLVNITDLGTLGGEVELRVAVVLGSASAATSHLS